MMIVSLTSYGQNYPRKAIIDGVPVWIFTPEQTLRMVEITLERNAFQEINDSLKLDLSRCEFTSQKKTEEIGLLNQKSTLYADFIEHQIKKNNELTNAQTKTSRQLKLFRNFSFVLIGSTVVLFLLR